MVGEGGGGVLKGSSRWEGNVGGGGVRWNAGTAVVGGVDIGGETPCMLLRMDTSQWDTREWTPTGHQQVAPHHGAHMYWGVIWPLAGF